MWSWSEHTPVTYLPGVLGNLTQFDRVYNKDLSYSAGRRHIRMFRGTCPCVVPLLQISRRWPSELSGAVLKSSISLGRQLSQASQDLSFHGKKISPSCSQVDQCANAVSAILCPILQHSKIQAVKLWNRETSVNHSRCIGGLFHDTKKKTDMPGVPYAIKENTTRLNLTINLTSILHHLTTSYQRRSSA